MQDHQNKYSALLSKHRIEKILNEKLDDDYHKYMELIDLNHLRDALQIMSKSMMEEYDKYKVS